MADDEKKTCCVDAHCHLVDEQFKHDIDDVVDRAKKVGVIAALCVAITPLDFEKIISLNNRFPNFVVPCLGVHPVQEGEGLTTRCVTIQDLEEAIPLIEKYSGRIAAIGEVGLDFTPRFCPTDDHKTTQRQVLQTQVGLAQKYNLPLNVHSRSAGRPTIALLKEQGAKDVLLHAFDGRPSVAMEGLKEGYYFSIPPSIVRSEQKQKLIKTLPLEHIILESDSPALGPEKQVRNEPSNIKISAEYIAKIKNIDLDKVLTQTTNNVVRLFPKLKSFVNFK